MPARPNQNRPPSRPGTPGQAGGAARPGAPGKGGQAGKGPRPASGRRRSGGGRRKQFHQQSKVVPEDGEEKAVEVEGTISAVLAGTMFRVQMASGHEVLAHISGKMRKRFIRLVVGDRVRMEMSPYDLTKARIVFRL